MDKAQIKMWWEIFHVEGSPMEIRILANDKKATYSGYYKDINTLIKDVKPHDSRPEQIYFVLNELHEGCYSRAQRERLITVKTTTSDNDVVMRRWLLIDTDPVRPQGISATDEELDKVAGGVGAPQDFADDVAGKAGAAGKAGKITHNVIK